MEDSFSLEDKSEFNIALATLMRVNAILNMTSICTQKKQLNEWFNWLLSLEKEVDYMFNKEEETENKELNNELIKLSNQYILKKKEKGYESYGLFYMKLKSYERFLRTCFKSRDMLLVGKSEQSLF